MTDESINFLKKHESSTPSKFEDEAKWRLANKGWLQWSRNVSLILVDYMEKNGLTRNGLAECLGVSPQYVSRLLSGKVNLSFRSVAELEAKLGLKCINVNNCVCI